MELVSLWTGNTVTTCQKEDAVGIALSVSGREVTLVSRSTRPGVPEGDRGWENSVETGASRARWSMADTYFSDFQTIHLCCFK